MPDSFSISRANPIHFRIETGVNAINANADIAENYLYNDADLTDWYNCDGLDIPGNAKGHCYQYDADEQTYIQVKYSTTIENPIFPVTEILWAEILDADGNFVSVLDDSQPYTDTNYWNFLLDPYNQIPSNEIEQCFQIVIKTPSTDSQVAIPWGDNGTFESGATWNSFWSSGTTPNTTARDTTIFRSGAASAKITAPGSPALLDSEFFIQVGSLSLTSDTVYTISAYLWEDSGTPFSDATSEVKWDLSGFSDAEILHEKRVNFTADGQDAWVVCSATFRVKADTSATVKLVTVSQSTGARIAPQANGILYMDDFLLAEEIERTQATSEQIFIGNECKCTSLVEYYAGDGSSELLFMGLLLKQSAEDARFRYRVSVNILKRYYDGKLTLKTASDGTVYVPYFRPLKYIKFETGAIPPFMVEIIALSMGMPYFYIDGIRYGLESGTIEPKIINQGEAFIIDVDLVQSGFNYESKDCE